MIPSAWKRRSLVAFLTTLVAACGGPENGPALSSQDALALSTVSSPGPLAISLTAPSQGIVGAPLPVTATATNTTAGPVSGVSVSVAFTFGTRIGGGLPAECARLGANIVTCSVGALAGGASYTLSVTATPTAPGPLGAGAFVGTNTGAFATNSVGATIDVIPGPTDVQVTGFASTGSPTLGSPFTYTFQVKNNGPQLAGAVAFSDVLPPTVGLVGATTTAPGGTCTAAAGAVSCALGDLPVGAQVNVVISAIAPATTGAVSDTAAVSSTYGDLQLQNNSFTVTVQPK